MKGQIRHLILFFWPVEMPKAVFTHALPKVRVNALLTGRKSGRR